jgi:transposase
MKITQEQYKLIESHLPKQRGNVRMEKIQFINAIMYVAENGRKWRGLSKEYGNWHSVYVRMSRWSKRGVLARLFEALQRENIIRIKIESACKEQDRKIFLTH